MTSSAGWAGKVHPLTGEIRVTDMRYFAKRFLQFVIVFVIVTFVVMVFTRIGSNDPSATSPAAPSARRRSSRSRADYPYLDKPIAVQQYVLLARRTGL